MEKRQKLFKVPSTPNTPKMLTGVDRGKSDNGETLKGGAVVEEVYLLVVRAL